MDSSNSILPAMAALSINKNSIGWGPSDIPAEFKNMPYQPFSKDTRLGKIADWSGNVYQDMKHKNRYTSIFGGGGQYAYYHDDDDANFQTAGGSVKPKQVSYLKTRQRIITQQRKQRGGMTYNPRQNSFSQQKLRQNLPAAGYQSRKLNPRQQDNRNRTVRIIREPSIQIQDNWLTIDEIDLNRLGSLSLPNLPKPINLADFGELGYLDPAIDRVTTKSEIPLEEGTSFQSMYIPLMHDSVVLELITNKLGNVFISSQVACLLMCCPRSIYSWDLVAYKDEGSLLIDFRDNYEEVDFDPQTVNETAQEPPPENMVKTMCYEGMYCTECFRKKVVQRGPKAQRFSFPSLIPDLEYDDENEDKNKSNGKQSRSLGWRYRLFDIGNGIKVVIRCEVDAVLKGEKKSDNKFVCVYALTENPMKTMGSVDWRTKLDTQAGAVLASELKNNSFKLARFITRAILSDASIVKLGYVSRVNPKDSMKHVILGAHQFKTPEFSQQIGFNVDNAWALLRCIIEHIMRMPDGWYLLQKDANKPILRFHTLPKDETFTKDKDYVTLDMDDEQLKEYKEQVAKDAQERLRLVNEALGNNKLGLVQSATL